MGWSQHAELWSCKSDIRQQWYVQERQPLPLSLFFNSDLSMEVYFPLRQICGDTALGP